MGACHHSVVRPQVADGGMASIIIIIIIIIIISFMQGIYTYTRAVHWKTRIFFFTEHLLQTLK